MLINGKECSVDDVLKDIIIESMMIKRRKNDIYLSDEDVELLNRYSIDYNSCADLKMLIYLIEDYLVDEENTELEELSIKLAEFDYYHNTKK